MLFPDLAYAAAGPPGGGSQSMLPTIVMVASMLAIFYFLLLRPQQKQKQERMLASMKRGDRVVTTSGMHGTVTALNEHTVVLRVADQVKLEFDRSAIGRVVAGQGEKDA
jgi:preprotein translocase subunit YajC